MLRRPWGLASLCLLATVVTVPAAAAPCARATAYRRGQWFVSTPAFPQRPAAYRALRGEQGALRAVAVDPADPRVAFATDGGSVVRSDDGGCTWHAVFSLPDAPGALTPDGVVGEIRSIDVARVAGRPRVLLAVQGTGDAPFSVRTVVVRSADGYRDWTPADTAFPGTYEAQSGTWAPVVRSGPGFAYAAVPGPAGTVAYYRSADDGKTWALRSAPTDTAVPMRMTAFAVSPWDADELWEWGGGRTRAGDRSPGLRKSTDGGATWTWLNPWPAFETRPAWESVDIAWPRRGAPARVVVVGDADDGEADDSPVLAWSSDGGRSFQVAVPPTTTYLYDAAVTHLANGDLVVVARTRLAWRVPNRGRAPAGREWRAMPKVPEAMAHSTVGSHGARASRTSPTVVVVPTARTVQFLAVAR